MRNKGQEAGTAGSSHLDLSGGKWRELNESEAFDPQRSHLTDTSLNKTAPSNPSQTVPPTGDQVFVFIQTTTGLVARRVEEDRKGKTVVIYA